MKNIQFRSSIIEVEMVLLVKESCPENNYLYVPNRKSILTQKYIDYLHTLPFRSRKDTFSTI